MSNKKRFNSHKHTRLNRYTSAPRKNRGFSPYWFILISAVCALILALLLGNFLGELADTAPNDDGSSDGGSEVKLPLPLDAQSIDGVFVTLNGISDSTTQNVRKQIPSGATAVSLQLFDGQGDPYYNSKIAASFGNKCGELTLSRVFDAFKNEESSLYSSVILPFSAALSNDDGTKQAVLNAYEGAIISELAEAGANDVIISVRITEDEPLYIDEVFLERLTQYVYTVRGLCPDLRIGFSLPLAYFSELQYSALTESMSKMFDFLVLDLTEFDAPESFEVAINAASVNILRRELRLLLLDKDEEYNARILEILDKNGMKNRQFASK